MTTFNFPNNPSVGDEEKDDHQQTWHYNGVAWIRISTGKGIEEAPIDDVQYARENGAWRKAAPDLLFLGYFDTPPTLDNYEQPLQEGMLYFDTILGTQRTWDGTVWNNFAPTITVSNARNYTWKLAADIPISGVLPYPDSYGNAPNGWEESVSNISLYHNGRRLIEQTDAALAFDYTIDYATSEVTLISVGMLTGDEVLLKVLDIVPAESGVHPYQNGITDTDGEPFDSIVNGEDTTIYLHGGNFDQNTMIYTNSTDVIITQKEAISDKLIRFVLNSNDFLGPINIVAYNDDREAFGETINLDVEAAAFKLILRITEPDTTMYLPTVPGYTYDYRTVWGDGANNSNVNWHTFVNPGDYELNIIGDFPAWDFTQDPTSKDLIVEVIDLGIVGWQALTNAFNGCSNLVKFNSGTTDTSLISDLTNLAANTPALEEFNIDSMDVSAVVNTTGIVSYSGLVTLDMSGVTFPLPIRANGMFIGMPNLISLVFPTCTPTAMSGIAAELPNITTLDFTPVSPAEVAYLRSICEGNALLTSVNLTAWVDVPNLKSAVKGFYGCPLLTDVELTSFNPTQLQQNGFEFLFGDPALPSSYSPWSTDQYDRALAYWALMTAADIVNLDAPMTKYTDSVSKGVLTLTRDNWIINDAGTYNEYPITLVYGLAPLFSNTVIIRVSGSTGYTGVVDIDIEWDEDTGESTHVTEIGTYQHTYTTGAGTATVKISGRCARLLFNPYLETRDSNLLSVEDMGDLPLFTYKDTFRNCNFLVDFKATTWSTIANSIPATNMFAGNLRMRRMDLSGLAPINNGDSMFTNMRLLEEANWETLKTLELTSGESMIQNCNIPNPDGITSLDLPVLVNAKRFFYRSEFVSPINTSLWQLPEVVTIAEMFAFTTLNGLYSATTQSIDLRNAGLTKLRYMRQAFEDADIAADVLFPVGRTVRPEHMQALFHQNPSIRRTNIGELNITGLTYDLVNLFSRKSGSTNRLNVVSYDAILVAWAAQAVLPNITADFATAQYTVAGEPSRNILVNAPNNWTINDAGLTS